MLQSDGFPFEDIDKISGERWRRRETDKEDIRRLTQKVILACRRRVLSERLFSQESGGIKERSSLRTSNYSTNRGRCLSSP